MLESILLLTLLSGSKIIHNQKDCGLKDNYELISLTKSLIIKTSKLNVPISEIPTKSGHYACVRLKFKINQHGKAEDIRTVEDYGSLLLDLSAVDALKRYKFKKRCSIKADQIRDYYSLVFTATVNKAPPYPEPRTKNQRGPGSFFLGR